MSCWCSYIFFFVTFFFVSNNGYVNCIFSCVDCCLLQAQFTWTYSWQPPSRYPPTILRFESWTCMAAAKSSWYCIFFIFICFLFPFPTCKKPAYNIACGFFFCLLCFVRVHGRFAHGSLRLVTHMNESCHKCMVESCHACE